MFGWRASHLTLDPRAGLPRRLLRNDSWPGNVSLPFDMTITPARDAQRSAQRFMQRSAQRSAQRLALLVLPMLAACVTSGVRQRTAAELLREPGYAWRIDSTAHTRLHYVQGTAASDSIARVRNETERSWQQAATFVGGSAPEGRVDVFLVPERRMVGELAHLETPANALNFWRSHVVVGWLAPYSAQGPHALGPHEFVHVLASDVHGETKEWWLGEGAAVAASVWQGADVHAYAKCLADAGKLYPLAQLVPKPKNGLDPAITYPEAGSFARFLIVLYGRDKFWSVYPRGVAAVPEVYGKTLDALEQEWRRAIGEVDASRVRCAALAR